MEYFKKKEPLLQSILMNFSPEEGPFFGSKKASPLFPTLLIQWTNNAFFTVLAIALGICIYQGTQFFLKSEVSIEKAQPSTKTSEPLLSADTLKPFIQYASQFKKREVFKIYQVPGKKTVSAKPDKTIRQATAHLTLSGIIFEDVPQAIFVDKKKNKTYILKQGDYLENIKIEEIKRGRVKLRMDSQTLDIEL